MTKKGKLIAIIVASILILTALIVGIVLIVQNNKRENTQTTIMACSVNPSVHFVLNGNNKVVDVVALNHSGETLTVNANFVGLNAEDAAKQFISLSTNAGYINVDTEGTEVEITINGLNKNYDKLKNKVVSAINGYFDEKGIIAKATILSDTTLNNILADLKTTTATATDKSNQTLMDEYLAYAETIKDINRSSLSAFNQAYANYLEELEQNRADFQELIDELNTTINTLKTQLAALQDQNSEIARGINQQIASAEQRIKALKEDPASNPESIFANAIAELQKSFKISETTLQNIVTEYTTKVNGNLTKLQEHATRFAENKTEIQNKIAEYRAN